MSHQLRSLFDQLQVIAVTGTNGKTSTTSLIGAIIEMSGEDIALMTTIQAQVSNTIITKSTSTPKSKPTIFSQVLQLAVEKNVKTLALEVTSKSLSLGFASQFPPQVGVFTNLTQDHLLLHKNEQSYFEAKSQLFRNIKKGGFAILNADDTYYEQLCNIIPKHITILSYSIHKSDASLAAKMIDISYGGTVLKLHPSNIASAFNYSLYTPLIGKFQAQNALAAALATYCIGYSPTAIKNGLANVRPLKGRFEVISKNPFVIVDYAHTSDGLQNTLQTAQDLMLETSKLLCVFGCGGDRDREKRSSMGKIAAQYADFVCLTNDNPRYESPQQIIEDILRDIKTPKGTWIRIFNRKKAIEFTYQQAKKDDILIIAGKGHETTQEIRGKHEPFSDHEIVWEMIKKNNTRL